MERRLGRPDLQRRTRQRTTRQTWGAPYPATYMQRDTVTWTHRPARSCAPARSRASRSLVRPPAGAGNAMMRRNGERSGSNGSEDAAAPYAAGFRRPAHRRRLCDPINVDAPIPCGRQLFERYRPGPRWRSPRPRAKRGETAGLPPPMISASCRSPAVAQVSSAPVATAPVSRACRGASPSASQSCCPLAAASAIVGLGGGIH